ncbi:NUDIX hydrolase [Cohnella suwonensis]|uniref:NUDIX hydrolase n=1 Tax=Cohnella suwonensis TaxID=696072 RepID=A0ABW0M0D9_9BACL
MNDELQVAMMEMSNLNLYKLPGGGVEEGEDKKAAFLREVREETGFGAAILHELGYIDEHKFRNQFMQRSYCYIAKVISSQGAVALTEKEIQLGMQMKWMNLDDAIFQMKDSVGRCKDFSAKFMLLRDLTILEFAVRWLTRSDRR